MSVSASSASGLPAGAAVGSPTAKAPLANAVAPSDAGAIGTSPKPLLIASGAIGGMSAKDAKAFVTDYVGIVDPLHPREYQGQVQLSYDPKTGRTWAYGQATGPNAPRYDVSGKSRQQIAYGTYGQLTLLAPPEDGGRTAWGHLDRLLPGVRRTLQRNAQDMSDLLGDTAPVVRPQDGATPAQVVGRIEQEVLPRYGLSNVYQLFDSSQRYGNAELAGHLDNAARTYSGDRWSFANALEGTRPGLGTRWQGLRDVQQRKSDARPYLDRQLRTLYTAQDALDRGQLSRKAFGDTLYSVKGNIQRSGYAGELSPKQREAIAHAESAYAKTHPASQPSGTRAERFVNGHDFGINTGAGWKLIHTGRLFDPGAPQGAASPPAVRIGRLDDRTGKTIQLPPSIDPADKAAVSAWLHKFHRDDLTRAESLDQAFVPEADREKTLLNKAGDVALNAGEVFFGTPSDFAKLLFSDPGRVAQEIYGGSLGGLMTIADMVIGTARFAKTIVFDGTILGVAGLVQIMGRVGAIGPAALRFVGQNDAAARVERAQENPVSDWALSHGVQAQDAVVKMIDFVVDHHAEFGDMASRALEGELREIKRLQDHGMWADAAFRFGHLASSVVAAFVAPFAGAKGAASASKLSELADISLANELKHPSNFKPNRSLPSFVMNKAPGAAASTPTSLLVPPVKVTDVATPPVKPAQTVVPVTPRPTAVTPLQGIVPAAGAQVRAQALTPSAALQGLEDSLAAFRADTSAQREIDVARAVAKADALFKGKRSDRAKAGITPAQRDQWISLRRDADPVNLNALRAASKAGTPAPKVPAPERPPATPAAEPHIGASSGPDPSLAGTWGGYGASLDAGGLGAYRSRFPDLDDRQFAELAGLLRRSGLDADSIVYRGLPKEFVSTSADGKASVFGNDRAVGKVIDIYAPRPASGLANSDGQVMPLFLRQASYPNTTPTELGGGIYTANGPAFAGGFGGDSGVMVGIRVGDLLDMGARPYPDHVITGSDAQAIFWASPPSRAIPVSSIAQTPRAAAVVATAASSQSTGPSNPIAGVVQKVQRAAEKASDKVAAKVGRVTDKAPAALEQGLDRIDPKPGPRPRGAAPNATTPPRPTSAIGRFSQRLGDALAPLTRPVADAVATPGKVLADVRSRALGAGRNLYYPNQERALLKEAEKLAANVVTVEAKYQGASSRIDADIAGLDRTLASAQRYEAQAQALRGSDPAKALQYTERAQQLAAQADRSVQYGLGELGTERFSKTLDGLERQLTALQGRVESAKRDLAQVQTATTDSREVMVARQRYDGAVKKLDAFMNSDGQLHVTDPLVQSTLAAAKPGRALGDKVSSSIQLRQAIDDLRAINDSVQALPKPLSLAEYGQASVAAGETPSVAGYLANRRDALRAVREELLLRADAATESNAAATRKIGKRQLKAGMDTAAASSPNALDIGQAGVEYSELKKLNKNQLSAALNATGIRKASEEVEVMKAVVKQARADGQGVLERDASKELEVLQRKLDLAQRSADIGGARKVMNRASAGATRANNAAVRAAEVFKADTDRFTPQIATLQRELLETQGRLEAAPLGEYASLRVQALRTERKLESLRERIRSAASGAERSLEIADHSQSLLGRMQRRVNEAERFAGLTPSKLLVKPIAWAVKKSLEVGWATTIGGLPLNMTKIVTNDPAVLARYNIAPAELTLMHEKGIGVVTLDGPLADITAFWQGPSLKGPTMAALVGEKGSPSPSFFGSTTKEGQRYNFVFTSDSAQALQLGAGITVGTPNLNTQWLGQFRLATVGDTLRFVSTSDHPKAKFGASPQLEFVTTGASGIRIPGTRFDLPITAVVSTSTKVNVGEFGVTTVKEAAPRRLFSVTGVPVPNAGRAHSSGYGKDAGEYGYLSQYTNVIEPNYVLREAEKNKIELARDPFSSLQAPTHWLKGKTFDVFVVAPGKALVTPLTDSMQSVIQGIRARAQDALRGISGGGKAPPAPIDSRPTHQGNR